MLPGIADLEYPNSTTRRGRVQEKGQICPTLTTENIPNVLEEWMWEVDGVTYLIRIRKLTVKECFRLMGVTDSDFEKIKYNKETLYLEGGDLGCNAKLKVVEEKQRQLGTETYALCTIKESSEQEVLKKMLQDTTETQSKELMLNVSIVTEKSERLEQWECATSTTKCIDFMGMHFTVKDNQNLHVTVITAQGWDKRNTEKSMKIIMESNLSELNKYTILILFAQIIELKIFTSSTIAANITGAMQIIEGKENNILMRLSDLRMEHISERISNTEGYKQAGNSIVVDVMENIFREMMPDDWSQYMNPPVED